MLRTKLKRLYEEQAQSPWLDNPTRPYLEDGTTYDERGGDGFVLVGRCSLNPLTEKTITASGGWLAGSDNRDPKGARPVPGCLGDLGTDQEGVPPAPGDQGVADFHESVQEVLGAPAAKSFALPRS